MFIGAASYQSSWFNMTHKTATNMRLRIPEIIFKTKPPFIFRNVETTGDKYIK